jgi:hypothetical protein
LVVDFHIARPAEDTVDGEDRVADCNRIH